MPPFVARGPTPVVLDTISFPTDPSTYEPLNWAKRHSVHMTIGGKVTIQDFGTFMKDNTLRLGSGDRNLLDEATVLALHTRFRTRGVVYSFSDWLGNSFTVFIKTFVPIPIRKGRNDDGTTLSLYQYEMEIQVITIVNLVGVAYTGS